MEGSCRRGLWVPQKGISHCGHMKGPVDVIIFTASGDRCFVAQLDSKHMSIKIMRSSWQINKSDQLIWPSAGLGKGESVWDLMGS